MAFSYSKSDLDSQEYLFHNYNFYSKKIYNGIKNKKVKESDFSYLPDLNKFTMNRKGQIFKYKYGESGKSYVGQWGEKGLVTEYMNSYSFLKSAYRKFQYLLSKKY